MATNTFSSTYHRRSLRRRHSIHCPRTTANSFFLRPTTTTTTTTSTATAAPNPSLSHSTAFAVSSATYSTPTTNPSTSQNISFDLLQHYLSSKNLRQADEEARCLLIVLAGEAAQKRGFFSEVQFISEDDLETIDGLWRPHSDNKFGYSVQIRTWNKVNKDFTKFFIKVGWMKPLERSEVEQYNYRSFPTEFMWEMEEGTPEGHLPLTNALRGTQLLNGILNHPAFKGDQGEEEGKLDVGEEDRSDSGTIGPNP